MGRSWFGMLLPWPRRKPHPSSSLMSWMPLAPSGKGMDPHSPTLSFSSLGASWTSGFSFGVSPLTGFPAAFPHGCSHVSFKTGHITQAPTVPHPNRAYLKPWDSSLQPGMSAGLVMACNPMWVATSVPLFPCTSSLQASSCFIVSSFLPLFCSSLF